MLLKANTRTQYFATGKETYLEVTKIGGETKSIRRPFDPYMYMLDLLYHGGIDVEPVKRKLLSTLEERDVLKVSFANTEDLKYSRGAGAVECEVPYDQRIAIDMGFKSKSDAPRHDAFDLEMESTRGGMFPNALYDRITAISYFGESIAECDTLFDMPEYEMLSRFVERVQQRNPDMLDSFFGSYADFPWLIQRCAVNNLKLSLGRDGSEPWVKTRTFQSGKNVGENRIIDINGRVHFDVWKEVNQDQTLFGIKNRQLKTVAKWMGIPVIEVDRADMAKLNQEQLRKYCLSDAHATYRLAQIYSRNLAALSDFLEITLDMTINRSPSHVANYIYMREFRKNGIITDKKNFERYPEFRNSEQKSAYQGALVTLFNPGLYEEKGGHIDANSMYPADMICFNYSPETLLETRIRPELQIDNWVQFVEPNEIRVYDKKLGVICCKIDLTHDSISRIKLTEMFDKRKIVKLALNTLKDAKGIFVDAIANIKGCKQNLSVTEIAAIAYLEEGCNEEVLNSIQWAIKVMMNSIPGYNGMGFASCGAFPIAAQICGLGRWEITEATNYVKSVGCLPIERDTDGLYYMGDDLSGEITRLIQNKIPDQYQREVIKFGFDTFDAGIFYDEKGYVLRDGNKLIMHGSGLKGRHLPKVTDWALERLVWAIFKHDDIPGVLNGIGADVRKDQVIGDFLMTIRMSKDPAQYASTNQYGKLVKIAKDADIDIRWGDEFQYLKTSDGFKPYAVVFGKPVKLDYDYYYERIANVLTRILQVTHGYTFSTVYAYLKGNKLLSAYLY